MNIPHPKSQSRLLFRLTRKWLRLALLIAAIFSGHFTISASAQDTVLLWPENPELNAPENMGVSRERGGKTRVTQVGTPHLNAYLTEESGEPTPAVILCPGGGYGKLVPSIHWPIAEWLNEQGVSAFILMYRCPSDRHNGATVPDAQRAIRMLRERAVEWNIDPDRIGLLGTSAGGNLAARTSLSFEQSTYPIHQAVDRNSARPDFVTLLYPAYLAHRKTGNLAPWIDIPGNTPPTLIISARDDTKHFPNSPVYENALEEAGVPVRAHYFDEGGHGFGLRDAPPTADWPEMYLEWLKHIQILH